MAPPAGNFIQSTPEKMSKASFHAQVGSVTPARSDASDSNLEGGVKLQTLILSGVPSTAATECGQRFKDGDSDTSSMTIPSAAQYLGKTGDRNGHNAAIGRDTLQPRRVLLCTLHILRYELARNSQLSAYLKWLDSAFPVGGGLAAEQDIFIPNISYSAMYMTSDLDFTMFENLVLQCPLACKIQMILSVGGAEFDKVNEGMGTYRHVS